MTDPRITRLADLLVNYSLDLQPGQQFLLRSTPTATPLNQALYEAAVRAGAHVLPQIDIPGAQETLFKHGSDEQLTHVLPVLRQVAETFDAALRVLAPTNTRALSGVDPARQQVAMRGLAEMAQITRRRVASGDLASTLTVFPNSAMAQEADMSLAEYEDFVYTAGHLHEENPIAFWQAESERQQKLVDWLAGHDQVHFQGSNIDLRLSIKGRSFIKAAGRQNFPDGEIYTSPVETSVEGWVNFSYPAIYAGREVTNIRLWFEEGQVVKEEADKGQELLSAMLNTDEGARYLGEWGIGTNYNIQRFTKHMLFDEKMGGTIHLALGFGFPEAGSENDSGLHWDMLCDMADSEITVDGELFYKDGQFQLL